MGRIRKQSSTSIRHMGILLLVAGFSRVVRKSHSAFGYYYGLALVSACESVWPDDDLSYLTDQYYFRILEHIMKIVGAWIPPIAEIYRDSSELYDQNSHSTC